MEKKFFERAAESPAVAIDRVVESSKKVGGWATSPLQRARNYWHVLGPGLTTGASDDDPSGIATYSQTGAQTGYNFLWLSVVTFPLMAMVQEMCARIGLVTGRGLAANIRLHFPKWVLYSCAGLLFLANGFNIGANLGAMAKGSQLLWPSLPFAGLVIFFTFLSLGLQIFSTYEKYAKYLKWLALVLLSYVFTALSIDGLDWWMVLREGFTPNITWNRDTIILICAILGTTISPYLFFWQTSQEVEERILGGMTNLKLREGCTDSELKNMRTDVWSGMFLSNIVMFFIIATCAATLFANGITNIGSAADAAAALKPLAGDRASLLFAIGIIGTGLLAIPVLAGSSSYAIAESFGWRAGLYRRLKNAYAFYGVLIFSMLVGLIMNFVGLDPIKALIYSAVANGVVAPVVLVLIVMISSNHRVMKERTNSRFTTVIGWFVVGIMAVAGLAAIFSL